jgi:hexosaminidase
MRIFAFIFSIIEFVGFSQTACPIIPTPIKFEVSNGVIDIGAKLTVNASNVPENVFHYFKRELDVYYDIAVVINDSDADVSFYREKNKAENAYEIQINENVVVRYSNDESCFYAVNSLIQLIQGTRNNWSLRKCFVYDAPRFQWRGLHLDVSRHFFSVDEVKRYIDLMALYKFNTFHWHLTDDQGWRIEIKKYPKLTAIGSVRDSTIIGHYNDQPRMYDTTTYTGYYSQREIKEVVDYAASKYITVVPEIEMPGHSRAALAAYPQYSCNGQSQSVPGVWGVFDDIYCSKKETVDFMKDVLSEVLELFPSEYIHIGGDEAPKKRWKRCSECQNVIESNNLKDEHELQSYFIRQIDAFLTSKGRKLIGWDEILEGGLSPNAAVMSWRGEKGGIEAAKQGHYVVMSPTTYCYFDYYQSSHSMEPLAIGGYLPLEKVYQYSPIPNGLTVEEEKYILGGQANLWTEYIPDMDHLEYMTYPRALALIQGLWCSTKPNYEEFLETYLVYHEDYLKRHNVNFSRSIHYPNLIIERAVNGINMNFKGASEDVVFKMAIDSIGRPSSEEWVEIGGNDPLFLARTNKGNKNVRFKLLSTAFEDTVTYLFTANSNLGVPIDLLTLPHPKYNNNGSLNMVDGIKGTMPWKGSEWLGFNETEVNFIVDLEEQRQVSTIKIGLLEKNGSWIYLPTEITVYGSEDKKNWKFAVSKKVDSESLTNGTLDIEIDADSRYFKISLKAMDVIPEGMDGAGNIPWTFIDEIEIK